MRIFSSSPKRSEYEKVFATVQKAEISGRQLRVDKKGNLKSRGAIGSFFLRRKINRFSAKEYKSYIGGERKEVRSAVLKVLDGVARQSRKEAILNSRQGSLDPEREKASLNDFLDQYVEQNRAGFEKKERSDDISTSDFNAAATDFLRLSKSTAYSRKPVCPDFHDPGKPPADREEITPQQKIQLNSYQKSMRIYKFATETHKLIEQTGFHEPPKPFAEPSQNRVQFFSSGHDQLFIDLEKYGGSDQTDKTVINALRSDIRLDNEGDKLPRFSSTTTWNKADFKDRTGKRLLGEVNKRKRLGQTLPQQGVSDKALDFLCFLRKDVQTQFAKEGDLPEHLQSLFNENSAVSIQNSSAHPDRLVASKKLVGRALDICMGKTETAPSAATEKKVPTFSDDVNVREIDSRHVAKGLLQVAVQDGHFVPDPLEKSSILGYEQESNPTTAEEALGGSTYHYEEKGLPEGFEKHVPDGRVRLAAANSGNEDISSAGSGLAGGGGEKIGGSDGSWLQEQYSAWLTRGQGGIRRQSVLGS